MAFRYGSSRDENGDGELAMKKPTRVIAGAAALALGGSMALTVTPASAAIVGRHCQGTAVRACVEVRSDDDLDHRAWAKISDNQRDGANYQVWVNHLQLQQYTTRGWVRVAHSADTDGEYNSWETARTPWYYCKHWGPDQITRRIRAKASFHWQQVGSKTVHNLTMYAGAKTVCTLTGGLD